MRCFSMFPINYRHPERWTLSFCHIVCVYVWVCVRYMMFRWVHGKELILRSRYRESFIVRRGLNLALAYSLLLKHHLMGTTYILIGPTHISLNDTHLGHLLWLVPIIRLCELTFICCFVGLSSTRCVCVSVGVQLGVEPNLAYH